MDQQPAGRTTLMLQLAAAAAAAAALSLCVFGEHILRRGACSGGDAAEELQRRGTVGHGGGAPAGPGPPKTYACAAPLCVGRLRLGQQCRGPLWLAMAAAAAAARVGRGAGGR